MGTARNEVNLSLGPWALPFPDAVITFLSSAGLSWPGEPRDRGAGINDGAAFLVLADGDKAVAAGHKPLARLVS